MAIDSDKNKDQEKFGVDYNPNGPWANLKDKSIQDAILRLAGENHASCAADNPKFKEFADFLDAFAGAWLEQRAQVESDHKNTDLFHAIALRKFRKKIAIKRHYCPLR